MKTKTMLAGLFLALIFACAFNLNAADAKKIILVAGKLARKPGEHEFRAGCLLLKSCLEQTPGITAAVITNDWPAAANAFDGADAIVLYMDGGDGHPAVQGDHLAQLAAAMKRGAGLVCLHYAVQVPITNGGPEWLSWLGGYFETNRSSKATWQSDFTQLPDHPVTRGVKPFGIYDEWYHHLRFADQGVVTPILTIVPPEKKRPQPDASQPAPAHTAAPQTVAWAYQRPDGGRGFGFSGGHFLKNLGNDDFRKLVLNGILWAAKAEVPAGGVASTVTPEEFMQNLGPYPPKAN